MTDLQSVPEEQRFRLLVNAVTDYAIYMLDPHGSVQTWNPGAERFKGYTADEIVGQHFSRFYSEEDRASGEPQRALETALRAGKYEREAWRVRKDGSLFWAHVVIDPIFDEDGEHVGFTKITRDATERKRAEEELEQTRAALAQSQKLQALGELTGGVAHDFNNLMTVIGGSADFLLRRPDLGDDKRRQYLEAIAETVARATRLTDHLLAFGRRQPIRPEVIDVNARLRAFSEVLARTLGRQVEVDLDLAPDVGNIEVDVAQLETAILNAALNARDAMPNGGVLGLASTIEHTSDGPRTRIEIRDSGLGMPPRVLERAFEPFFTTKEVGKGTGLGLSQIHGFAAQAGGFADIQSTEGQGTTVALVLPQVDKPVRAESKDDRPSPLPKGLKVLLVEDNLQVRDFARDLLVDIGCEVSTAASGEEALNLIDSEGVELVLTDIVMPGMSGVELAGRLRDTHPHLPVLLATGYSDEVVDRRSRHPVIAKPYGPRELSEAISTALSLHNDRAA